MSGEARVNVRRMVMLRQPPQRVWETLRDHLPVVAPLIDGIDEIRLLEREERAGGMVRTVHEWRAAPSLSGALHSQLDGGVLCWVERAVWNDAPFESRWSVESAILGGGLVGSGITRVEPAMGGRGSRLQLEVSTSITPGALGPLGDGRWRSGLEDAAAALLARTLQDLGTAVETYLSGTGRSGTFSGGK